MSKTGQMNHTWEMPIPLQQLQREPRLYSSATDVINEDVQTEMNPTQSHTQRVTYLPNVYFNVQVLPTWVGAEQNELEWSIPAPRAHPRTLQSMTIFIFFPVQFQIYQ